jgi:PAS domain S-box-containing protein
MKTTKLASEEQPNEIGGAENEPLEDAAATSQKAWATAATKKNSAPVAAQNSGATAPKRAEGAKILSGKLNSRVNILLVDDRADKLLALEAILAPLSQNLVKARSGKEALRLILKQEFAVILMDVSMPGMDGFETAQFIRKRPATEHTPIIFVTSIGNSPSQMYQGYSLGAVDYILTPIVPEVLRAKVTVFVDLYRKTEQIRQQSERLRQMEEEEHKRRLAETVSKLETETKRNRFFTLARDMLGIGTFEGRLLQINSVWAEVLGYTEEELKSAPASAFIHPDDHPVIAERLKKLEQGEAVEYFEVRCRHKNGEYRWIGWTAAPFPSEKLIYVFGRDVTARKEAEEKISQLNGALEQRVAALSEINRELETFSYSISHDLRAPLRSMNGFAQALMDAEANKLSSSGVDCLRRITSSAKWMDSLLKDLLEYSRVARAAMPPTRVDLDELVSELVSVRDSEIREKQAYIEIKSPLGTVMTHSPTMQQILSNLIDNGLKFINPARSPHLRIWAERVAEGAGSDDSQLPANRLRIWVEDNGIGINPEYHEKIFGLFERLHGSNAFSGTGIGLAIVRKAVERMGGRVGLESQPDQGSRFWVEIPAAAESELATV